MGFALLKAAELEETTCCVCATRFAVDVIIMENRRKNAGSIHCPNGHSIGWHETDADRLRKELAAEKQKSAMEASTRRMVEEALEKERREAKRLKKRNDAGVCSCCNRTFQNLARHMNTKHKTK